MPFDILQDPTTFCQYVGMCPVPTLYEIRPIVTEKAVSQQVASSELCDICKLAVGEVDSLLQDNATEVSYLPWAWSCQPSHLHIQLKFVSEPVWQFYKNTDESVCQIKWVYQFNLEYWCTSSFVNNISDIISERVLDYGTSSVILDQLFLHSAIVFLINTAQGVTKMFPLDIHERQIW